MRCWKRLNTDGTTSTVESYSHDLNIEGAVEISEAEFDEFIASLPLLPPEPVRDLATEIDEIKIALKQIKSRLGV